MNKYSITTLFLITGTLLSAQTYTGVVKKNNWLTYSCMLHIYTDSTVSFVYEEAANSDYAEYVGSIKQLNDSVYQVSLEEVMVLSLSKAVPEVLGGPSFIISSDVTQKTEIGRVKIQYHNGYSEMYTCEADVALDIPLDVECIKKSKSDHCEVTLLDYKNKLTNQPLRFKSYFQTDTALVKDKNDDVVFEVMIKDGILQTMGRSAFQTGHFKLKEKKIE